MKQELKHGMKVKHKYIPHLLTVVADEKGPAYTGKEFEDNEISLSHAVDEYENGNLSIVGETQKELFTPGEWAVFPKESKFKVYSDDTVGSIIADCTGEYTILKQEEKIANATLIQAAPDMYRALKKCYEIFHQLAADGKYPESLLSQNGGTGITFITKALQKANPQL